MEIDGSQEGICPHCEDVGPVGEICGSEVCARRGYCFIPGQYFGWSEDKEVDPFLGRMLGDYLVVELLGVGGFGKVYLALQMPILMKSALKLLDVTGLDDEMRRTVMAKFEGEARALAQLSHPNIVRLIKYGFYGELPYLVMEYVEGGVTLAEEINNRADKNRWFYPDDIKRIVGQILDALEAAHAAQIVHRDLKPENLMLQQAPGHPDLLRVLDFGLAKYVGMSSSTKTAMGTPEFVAPEVLSGRDIGPWTDLYSLGALVYVLLSDRYPFSTTSLDMVWSQKLDAAFDPVEELLDLHLPNEMHFFLRKSMARRPEDRFRTTAAFRNAFYAAVEAMPTDFAIYGEGAVGGEKNKGNLGNKSGDTKEKPGAGVSEAKHRIHGKLTTKPGKVGVKSFVEQGAVEEGMEKNGHENENENENKNKNKNKNKNEKNSQEEGSGLMHDHKEQGVSSEGRNKNSREAFTRWLKSEESRLKLQEKSLKDKKVLEHTAFSNRSLGALEFSDDSPNNSSDKGQEK